MSVRLSCKTVIKKILHYGIVSSLVFYLFKMIFTVDWISVSTTAINVFVATILPSVLPFAILVFLLKFTTNEDAFALKIDRATKKVFKTSGYGLIAIILGILSGYPSGGAIASEYLTHNKIDVRTAKKVFTTTNVPSPLLIITCIGGITYKSITLGVIMFLSIILSTYISNLIVFPTHATIYKNISTPHKNQQTPDNGVQNTIKSIATSAGLTCLFYVLADSVFSLSTTVINSEIFGSFFGGNNVFIATILGLIETTRGANQFAIVLSPFSASVCIFTLVLGGIPIWILNLHYAKKLKIKTARFLLFKTLQSLLSLCINYLAFLLYLV